MQTPLQITFHQLPPSPALETDIRLRVADLEAFSNQILSCRVSLEAPHRHHHQGQLYSVSIDVSLPGHHIVVSRSPDEDEAHADPHVAIRDAFDAAKRQLEGHSRRR